MPAPIEKQEIMNRMITGHQAPLSELQAFQLEAAFRGALQTGLALPVPNRTRLPGQKTHVMAALSQMSRAGGLHFLMEGNLGLKPSTS